MHDLVTMVYALAYGRVLYEPVPQFRYRQHGDNTVAKTGKKLWGKLKGTWYFWMSPAWKNQISRLALRVVEDLDDDHGKLDESERNYLKMLGRCPRKHTDRIRICRSPLTVSTNRKGVRSFRIRVLLGLI